MLWSTQQLGVATVLDPAGFALGEWPGVLDAVTPGAKESVPVPVAVGSADPLVPASTASTWQAQACAAGTDATLVLVDGAGYSTIITELTDTAIAFTSRTASTALVSREHVGLGGVHECCGHGKPAGEHDGHLVPVRGEIGGSVRVKIDQNAAATISCCAFGTGASRLRT